MSMLIRARSVCYGPWMLARVLVVGALLPACIIDAPHYRLPDDAAVDADPGDPDAPIGFRVGGTVSGLWDGAGVSLRITVDREPTTRSVGANGTFEFDDAYPDGTSFVVEVATDPPDHSCQVVGGIGSLDEGDYTAIEVTCEGPAVDISVAPPLQWTTFEPADDEQTLPVSILQQSISFIVSAPTVDEITVDSSVVASGATSAPITLSVGTNDVEVRCELGTMSRTFAIHVDRGAATIEPYATFLGSNTEGPDQFGTSVDMDGDTLVVGAPGEASGNGDPNDNSAPGAGAVYVFRRNGSTWTEEAYLKPGTIHAEARFGFSVAIADDVLIVGAPDVSQEDGGTRQGRAYVFRRTGTEWAQETYFEGDASAGDEFGRSVAIDSPTMVVVGAPSYSASGGLRSGAMHLYFKQTTVWEHRGAQHLNPDIDDLFGFSIQIAGNTVAVGAPGEASCATGIGGSQADDGCDAAGAVFVYRIAAGFQLELEAFVKASNTDPVDRFAESIALANDGATLVVGASSEDSGDPANPADNSLLYAGAAYAYERTGTSWAQTGYLKSSPIGEAFGHRVSMAGDLIDVDGQLFRRVSGTWTKVGGVEGGGPLTSDGAAGAGQIYR